MRCRSLISLAAVSLVLLQTLAFAEDGLKGTLPDQFLSPDTICATAGKAVDEKGFVLIGCIK